MPPFRRVEDSKAGPTALGILVPPGQRTVVILRPRGLPWDLLAGNMQQGTGMLRLCDFAREEAAGVARELFLHLEKAALELSSHLEIGADTGGRDFLVWLRQAELIWIACQRRPGQSYQPTHFGSFEEAQDAASQVAAFVNPAPDAAQEVYFNTQHFSR